MSQKVYETVTKLIVEALENGTAPWNKPWSGDGAALRANGVPYRGFNQMLLSFVQMKNGYTSNIWLTENQIQKLGGQIRGADYGEDYKENKRKHAVHVIFSQWKVKEETQNNGTVKKSTFPMNRWYIVYNLDVTDIVQKGKLPANLKKETKTIEFSPIEAAQAIWDNYQDKPTLLHNEQKAYYRPATDEINMPKPETFVSSEEYFSVIFHEAGHSTGAKKRLNRPTLTDMAPFGSPVYSQEELVAEMTAAYLCGVAGIENKTIENSTNYIAGWLRKIKSDPQILVKAASQAQKAADFILGNNEEEKDEE